MVYDLHDVGHYVVLCEVNFMVKICHVVFKKSLILAPGSDIKLTGVKAFTLPCPTSRRSEQPE